LEKATKLLAPYRGKIAKIEKIKNVSLGILAVVFLIVAIWAGMSSGNWIWTAFLTALFVSLAALTIYFIKFAYTRALRQSHMLLSLFCRVENNRLYLKLGLEIRPGYLAKWIEILVVD
jgi:glycerol-3-phosphate acyltransferase PlsY